jgi:predicted carbohydrate-binding protein with CBM5 and CBM33 domain
MKRRSIAAAVGALLAPIIVVVLPSGTASAHGYISSPPSRQAQCAQGTVSCGSIRYEPQSVEGPKGLRNCHGNVGRFAELSDNSKPWRATSVGRQLSFTWTLTARHRTSTWEYYLGSRRVASFNDNGAVPGSTKTHQVNLGNVSGRQRLLAIWNIADTSNAFYACVDLNVR